MTIGNNLKSGFYKFALVLLIMLTGYVLFFSIFNWTDSVVIYNAASYGARLFMLIPAGLSLILLIYVKKLLGKVPENGLIYIIIGLSVIMVGLQIIMIPAMEVSFRYDALKVVDEAVSIFMDGGISGDTFDGYFSRYTNNYGITIITFLVLKVLRVIGLLKADFSNVFPSLQAANLVMMDLSILFACLFVKENKGSRAAVLTLLIAVINPMTYVWALFYYTNTVSMAFMMFVLYAVNHLCMQNGENEKKWKNYLLCFLIGLFTFIGYQIRATMIITVAAILLFLLVHKNK